MSVTTEVKVVHRRIKSNSGRFLLPTDGDEDDMGLVMKIDSKPKDSVPKRSQTMIPNPGSAAPLVGMKNASAVRPSAVSSQLCGQGHEVTGWVLRGALFLQTAHIPFIKLTQKMSDTIQRKTKLLMPLLFYTSLLVLVAQASAVLILFFQSFMPIGMWFLLGCIGILAGMFCYTAELTNPHSKIPQQQLKSPTSGYKSV